MPGSCTWTTSKRSHVSASSRFARTPIGTPRLLRRETGIEGPSATTPSSSVPSRPSRFSARRPAASSVARPEGRGRRPRDLFGAQLGRGAGDVVVDGCGCDHANGVTMQILSSTARFYGPT